MSSRSGVKFSLHIRGGWWIFLHVRKEWIFFKSPTKKTDALPPKTPHPHPPPPACIKRLIPKRKAMKFNVYWQVDKMKYCTIIGSQNCHCVLTGGQICEFLPTEVTQMFIVYWQRRHKIIIIIMVWCLLASNARRAKLVFSTDGQSPPFQMPPLLYMRTSHII